MDSERFKTITVSKATKEHMNAMKILPCEPYGSVIERGLLALKKL